MRCWTVRVDAKQRNSLLWYFHNFIILVVLVALKPHSFVCESGTESCVLRESALRKLFLLALLLAALPSVSRH